MPFCHKCGQEVDPRDRFCARCGSPQSSPVTRPPDVLSGISPRVASILCYVPTLGWIAAVIVLATQRFRNDRTVRFHAFQALYLFAAWLVVQWALKPVFNEMNDYAPIAIVKVLEGFMIFLWIFMMVKAAHEEAYALPVIGELAQKSAAER